MTYKPYTMYIISAVLFALFASAVFSTQFQFKNNYPTTIWVGCQGSFGSPALNGGGWILLPGQQFSVFSPDNWAGRFWPRTNCNIITSHCETGDCGNRFLCSGSGGKPPTTLVEFQLKVDGGLDFYDITLVDGFNLPARIDPIGGKGNCKPSTCSYNILQDCPKELQSKNSAGIIVGCNSACIVYNTDQYCCRGAYSSVETCKTSDWQINSAKLFKDRCPNAISYDYDIQNNIFNCKAPTYRITFG